MRFQYFLYCIIGLLLMTSCSDNEVFDDFESGTLDKWEMDGCSFAVSSKSDYPSILGVEGNHFLQNKPGSSVSGTLTSRHFTIEKDYINFLMGGTTGWLTSTVSMNLIIGGVKEMSLSPIGPNPSEMSWLSFDVRQYRGREACLSVTVDAPRSLGTRVQEQGQILIDAITFSNRNFSDYLPEYSVKTNINKKYILIPGSNSGVGSRLSVIVDSVNILGQQQRVNIATDNIEYYIPVDVSRFQGKEAEVVLTGVRKSYAAYDAISTDNDCHVEYDEPYRPVYHFSPYFGWTNDPNGMVYHNGEWHLSFQSNPYGTTHGNMHWGNAVSKDLLNWEHLPFVIAPDELGSIFSGSAVVDKNNTAGFGEDAIVAVYTSAGRGQSQSIAYSADNGRTYTKYAENPVLSDPSQKDFRDPKVSWINDKWVMSLAVGDVIRFYGSKDLKNWELLSEFGRGVGSHAAVWECPDLMKMSYNGKEKWVLLVSINPGGPNGGSVTQYFIGDFDGTTFREDKLPYPLWIDLGVDNYAGVTFGNTGDRHLFMGWMSNWWYTNQTPTQYFRNAMTLPRDLSLKHNGKHLILASTPAPEILKARTGERLIGEMVIDGRKQIDEILPDKSGAYEIDMTIIPGSANNFRMSLANDKGESMDFCFDFTKPELSLDRSKSGLTDFSPKYVTSPITTPLVKRTEYKIQLFVDKMSTEMFINDGDVVFTNCMFPTKTLNTLVMSSDSGMPHVKDITIYEMKI